MINFLFYYNGENIENCLTFVDSLTIIVTIVFVIYKLIGKGYVIVSYEK